MNLLARTKSTWLYPALLLLIAAPLIFLYGQIDYTDPFYATTDLYHYRLMAQAAPALPTGIQQPYTYRLLGPYLAGLLPLPDPAAFHLLTILVALALPLAFYGFLRSHALLPSLAAFTTLLFLLNRHLFGFIVWDYFQIDDALSLLFLVLLLWMLRGDRPMLWAIFGIVLALGALTRETTILAIPVAFAYLIERRQLAARSNYLIAAILPALVLFFGLRLLIQPSGGPTLVEAFLHSAPKILDSSTLFRLLINPFIPLVFLPFIFFRTTLRFFRNHLYLFVYLVLVFASTLFGSNNERLMAPAFIIFYLLIAIILQERFLSKRNRSQPLFLALLLVCALLASLNHQWARYPLPSRNLTIFFSLGSLLVVSTSALLLIVSDRRSSPTQ